MSISTLSKLTVPLDSSQSASNQGLLNDLNYSIVLE